LQPILKQHSKAAEAAEAVDLTPVRVPYQEQVEVAVVAPFDLHLLETSQSLDLS
jgi:hypothetical protein